MTENITKIQIEISADDLVKRLLEISKTESVSILDSCGVGNDDSNLLIAGIKPIETLNISNINYQDTLSELNQLLKKKTASIFTISYDFGLKLEEIKPKKKEVSSFSEPDIFISTFDCLLIHNYKIGKTILEGNPQNAEKISNLILSTSSKLDKNQTYPASKLSSNFTKEEYVTKIEQIKEFIRQGDTYQTNLTQQFTAQLPTDLSPQHIFWNLRDDHPAPFASFIKRKNDYVVSISPERFIKINPKKRIIKTSPIKGTRPRGSNPTEDLKLKNELKNSKKDQAENIMIVDLLRNDIGKICKFGTVRVEKLCKLEEHPSLFHLVSTISGELRNEVEFADILKAVFPCGSITGCPKIRTMQIIDELETADRGLSMGAIGYCGFDDSIDLNVAIRTMVIKDQQAIFNVGGGVVYDSDAEAEYNESLLKAKALLKSIGVQKY